MHICLRAVCCITRKSALDDASVSVSDVFLNGVISNTNPTWENSTDVASSALLPAETDLANYNTAVDSAAKDERQITQIESML